VVEFRLAKAKLEEQAVHESKRRQLQAQQEAAGGEHKPRSKAGAGASASVDDDDESRPAAQPVAKLVPALLKADSAGALEAVRESLSHFPTDRVHLQIVKAELGSVTEADVQLADTVGAAILGFNVTAPSKVGQLAEEVGVTLESHRVIYELTDAVKDILEQAIEPVMEENVLGQADVLQLFTLTLNRKDRREGMSKHTQVAGGRVRSGEATLAAKVRVERKDEVVHEGRIVTLKHFKDEVKSVRTGQECGVVLANYTGCAEGDVLTFYEMVARKPSLYEGLPQERAPRDSG
jgi:translation initiation factor IF-2